MDLFVGDRVQLALTRCWCIGAYMERAAEVAVVAVYANDVGIKGDQHVGFDDVI